MKTLDLYKKNGLAKLDANFKKLIEPILETYQEDLQKANNNLKIMGYSDQYNNVIEAIVKDETIQSLLNNALGENYKLHSAYIRKVKDNAKGIRMHQDRPGETKLAILLTNNTSLNGGTVFYPGTHKWPYVLDSFPINPELIEKKLKGCLGQIGDVYLFSGRVWHGRLNSKSNENITLLLSFIPSWVPYSTRTLENGKFEACSPFLQNLIEPQASNIKDSEVEDKELFEMLTFKSSVSFFHTSRFLVLIHHIIKPIIKFIRKLRGTPDISENERMHYKLLKTYFEKT